LGFVLLRGAARVITQGTEHRAAVAALREKYLQYRTMSLDERPVIAADIQRATVWGNIDV
jgi:hypothetical protein